VRRSGGGGQSVLFSHLEKNTVFGYARRETTDGQWKQWFNEFDVEF